MSEHDAVPDGVPTSLIAALAAVQAELPDVNKSRTVEVENKAGEFQYSFDYADLFEISRKILPLLSKHGLAWMAKPTLGPDGKMALVYKLMHVSGQVEEGVYPLSHGGTAQQLGSAITFARRYCLCSVVGVAPKEDDDDGAAASRPVTAQRRARPQPNGDGGQPVQRARAAAPPLPGEQGYDRPAANGKATRPQVNKILAMFNKHGIEDRAERLNICSRLVRRPLGSANDMTNADVTTVVEAIEGVEQSGQPFRQWLVQLFQSTEDEAAAFAEDDGGEEPPADVAARLAAEQAALFADAGRPAPSTAGGMR